MATYTSVDLTFEIDSTSGGALSPITQYLQKVGSLSIKNGIVTNTPFGTGAVTKKVTGMVEMGEFDIEGEFEDTASTGPHVILQGARADKSLRSVKVTIGGGKYVSFEAYVSAYDYVPSVGGITQFKATIVPTGVVTEA